MSEACKGFAAVCAGHKACSRHSPAQLKMERGSMCMSHRGYLSDFRKFLATKRLWVLHFGLFPSTLGSAWEKLGAWLSGRIPTRQLWLRTAQLSERGSMCFARRDYLSAPALTFATSLFLGHKISLECGGVSDRRDL